MLAAGARVTGEDTDTGIRDRFKEWARELASKVRGPRVGTVNPRSLGVNPLLTISALAERSCEYVVQNRD
jgi:hypothetical protein